MKTLIFLSVATLFEAYGDSVIRRSLTPFRLGTFLFGAALLTTYGLVFNRRRLTMELPPLSMRRWSLLRFRS
jgi:hypothetical protein